jgi:hypothetical protein
VLAGTPRAAVVTVLVGSLALAACGHPAGPVPPPVTMSFCGGTAQATPDVVLVVCNTDDITARDLTWTAWGKSTSTATGTALVDLCAYSDCHTGAYGTVPIRLIASKIVACGGHARAYSRLRYVWPDGTPWPGIPADMNTSGYIAGPGRDLPPANQTVDLAC